MNALTIRDIPKEIEKIIKKRAVQYRTSLNKAVIGLLAEVTGKAAKPKKVHHDLDHLCGLWGRKESAEFDNALREQRNIDKELWK